jgi:hypothetical protein
VLKASQGLQVLEDYKGRKVQLVQQEGMEPLLQMELVIHPTYIGITPQEYGQ